MTIMTKLNTAQKIQNVFLKNNNQFVLTSELVEKVDAATQTVYSTISKMATVLPIQLERRGAEGGLYEYRLPSAIYGELAKKFADRVAEHFEPQIQQATKVEQPIVMETQQSDLALPTQSENKEPDVLVVPEGVSGVTLKKQKQRQAYWRDEDREQFAINFARLQAEHPLRDFEMLAMEAQASFPEEKRKTITKRGEISSWFEHCLNKARIQAKKEKEEQDKRDREAQLLVQMQHQEQQMRAQQSTILQTMSHMDLIGEVMRRGQSMIETMLCNALQSPNVQRALVNAIGVSPVERRMYPRPDSHSPNMPADATRQRLERIGVLGVNRPVHQGQMKANLKEMYDMRFGNVDGNATQLKESMAGCDLVIVLTDSVPHRTTAQLKAANIAFTPMAGDKRALEEFLSKRFLEKDKQ